jgi:hypothetical protein
MKKENAGKLAFNKAVVIELSNIESMKVIGGTEDKPVPTIIQELTKINWTAFI